MTTNYFDFFCKECGAHISRIDFDCPDSVGIRLMCRCEQCGEIYSFKIKATVPLYPVKEKSKFPWFYFKALGRRELNEYRKTLENEYRAK
jgi:hypothetical protein